MRLNSPAVPGESFALTLIAETGERFSDFAPYVASINDHGVVAFQAALSRGGTGVFTGGADVPGDAIVTVADTGGGVYSEFYSHPDIDNHHVVSVYARWRSSVQGVLAGRGDHMAAAVDTVGSFAGIGPLGPTMNDAGAVAFRATTRSGHHGVYVAAGQSIVTIADTRQFVEFHGLPVINSRGSVVFRADPGSGEQGIYASEGGSPRTVVDTRGQFRRLGSFPCVNDAGAVVFNAIRGDGVAGIYRATHGDVAVPEPPRPVIETDEYFDSFRGGLINDAGTVIFYATSRRERLGIYCHVGPDSRIARILSIGDSLFDSTVEEFALNPVSLNQRDQVAIRVRLASGRQAIVRADV